MQLKTNILKNIKLTSFLFFLGILAINAQKVKIDGVAVVIGKNIVLDSDIANFQKEVETRSEGKIKISDCEMLEELMQQKLLAHHAVIDSINVSQSEIDASVNNSIAYFTKEHGSQEKMLKVYGFNDIIDMKKELSRVQKDNKLIAGEQNKITEKVDVTPEEVRVYFRSLEENVALPEIPEEVQMAQIVIKAKAAKGEGERIINKLSEIKKQIEEGAGFKLKAIINSEDPSAAQNGGKLGYITKDANFIKEFKEVAFSLDIGQISEPFKTDFGYHIVLLSDIKGNSREVSHILMQPQIIDAAVNEAKELAEKIKKDVENKVLTFEEAVKKYSDDKATKNNGGLIINPYTGESTFEPTRMNDPSLYARISSLKTGELTEVFYDETREGEKMHKIIYMKNKTETHKADLVADYVKIQTLALQKKKEETVEKWSKEKIEDTYIKLNKSYKKCSFKKNWKKENK